MAGTPVWTIDVAHPPRRPDEVEEDLLRAWRKVENTPSLRILKIIHGYGSSGKGGSTREVARNWCFRNAGRFRGVINGEVYSSFETKTQDLRAEVGQYEDPDIHSPNPGITVVWIK